jgi:hypothetical protein
MKLKFKMFSHFLLPRVIFQNVNVVGCFSSGPRKRIAVDRVFETIISDFVRHLSVLKPLCFGNWFLFHLQVKRIQSETII